MNSKSLFPIVAILALLIVIISVVAAQTAVADSGPLDGETVCIDPGHGGSDPGATNEAYGLRESDINLDVSFRLQQLLEESGATVALTRTDDSYKTNADRYNFCNDKDATILVSVHTNSVTDPTWDGSMTLHAPNRSDKLARAIHEVMYSNLLVNAPAPEDFRDWGLDNFASGVLFKCDTSDAAMVEPLFMSHPAEAALLTQPILADPIYADPADYELDSGCPLSGCRRGEIAQAIYLGILNYFGAGPGGDMHVAAIEMTPNVKRNKVSISSEVAVQDAEGTAVPGVTVAHTFTLPDGSIIMDTGITADNGVATFTARSSSKGTFTSAVTNLSKSGWIYDPDANVLTAKTLLVE